MNLLEFKQEMESRIQEYSDQVKNNYEGSTTYWDSVNWLEDFSVWLENNADVFPDSIDEDEEEGEEI